MIITFVAVVSVQRAEQSNVPQQQQVGGAPQMVYPGAPIRYYQQDYITQRMNIFILLIIIDVFCFSKTNRGNSFIHAVTTNTSLL